MLVLLLKYCSCGEKSLVDGWEQKPVKGLPTSSNQNYQRQLGIPEISLPTDSLMLCSLTLHVHEFILMLPTCIPLINYSSVVGALLTWGLLSWPWGAC